MYLELAERKNKKTIEVASYKRSPRVSAHTRRKPTSLHEGVPEEDFYIRVPAPLNDGINDIYLREDYFDNLSDNEYEELMDNIELADEENGILAGKGKAKRAEKKERRNERKAQKATKKSDKNTRKNTRTNSKADLRTKKGNAKQTKAENGGGFDFNTAKDTVLDVVGKFTGGGRSSSGGGSSSDAPQDTTTDTSDTILGMPKMVAYGVGGALVLGGIYLATKK